MIAYLAFTALAIQASGSGGHDNMAMFDTDSTPIGVNNRCTGCISHKIEVNQTDPLKDSAAQKQQT
jgi:hypothetical protein